VSVVCAVEFSRDAQGACLSSREDLGEVQEPLRAIPGRRRALAVARLTSSTYGASVLLFYSLCSLVQLMEMWDVT